MRVVAFLAALLVGMSTLVTPASAAAPPVSRSELINRAASWLTANNGGRVPYSQETTWTDGYRQDCSGYASMAAKLGTPGPNTVQLNTDTWTMRIEVGAMLPGDLMIDSIGDGNNRHVVIFHKWSNPGKSAYMAYEQRGGYGTSYRAMTYGLFGSDQYVSRRLKNISGW